MESQRPLPSYCQGLHSSRGRRTDGHPTGSLDCCVHARSVYWQLISDIARANARRSSVRGGFARRCCGMARWCNSSSCCVRPGCKIDRFGWDSEASSGEMPMSLRSVSIPIITAGTIVLAACTSNVMIDGSPPSDCGATVLQDKIGLPVTGTSAPDVRVGGAPVRSRGDVRVIAPGQAVIQNYSDARLNLEIDGQNNLKRATCG